MSSRRSLLKQTVLAAPFLSRALLASPVGNAETSPHDQWYWYPGHTLTLKAIGNETGGTTTFILQENSFHEGVPLHKHLYEDESFYVIDGQFEITVGDRSIIGGPGTYAYGPRNVPHRWTNVGQSRGRFLSVFTPSGIEGYFLAAAIPIEHSTDDPHIDVAALQARTAPLREKFGIVRTGGLKYPINAASPR